MSFASAIKSELSKQKTSRICCRRAECYGVLLFGRSFSLNGISFTTESSDAAHCASQMVAQVSGAIVETKRILRRAEHTAFVISVEDIEDRRKILNMFGHDGNEIHLLLNHAVLENECCLSAFLRGAFLSCGTGVDPQKEYRLEFVVPHFHLAKSLSAILTEVPELALQPIISRRQGSYVVYLTGGDRISDFLTYLGAVQSSMEVMQAKMLKEVRNNVNRKTNFETANIGKTASAAALQIEAIERFLNLGGWAAIPEELRELAKKRYENPELSLRELGQSLETPLSRSGVNHRLQKLIELSEKLQKH